MKWKKFFVKMRFAARLCLIFLLLFQLTFRGGKFLNDFIKNLLTPFRFSLKFIPIEIFGVPWLILFIKRNYSIRRFYFLL